MKKWKEPAKRGLSLFLALIMCLGLLQISAFAEEGATVVTISKGADGAEIVAALNAAFPDETSDTWFYEAEGRVDFLGTSKVAWTNVDGTESIKEGRRTYKFLPLSKQWTYGSGKEDRPVDEYHGIYVNTVKSAEGRKEITLKVVDKSTPTIVLDNPGDVMLVHKRSDDGTYTDIDWDAVNNSILGLV